MAGMKQLPLGEFSEECNCCGEPISWTIQICDDTPEFVVNLGLLMAIYNRWRERYRLKPEKITEWYGW